MNQKSRKKIMILIPLIAITAAIVVLNNNAGKQTKCIPQPFCPPAPPACAAPAPPPAAPRPEPILTQIIIKPAQPPAPVYSEAVAIQKKVPEKPETLETAPETETAPSPEKSQRKPSRRYRFRRHPASPLPY